MTRFLQILCFVLLLLTQADSRDQPQANEEDVSVSVAGHPRDSSCHLDDVITARVSRPSGPAMYLHLRVHDVISTSSRQVYVMRQGKVEAVSVDQEFISQKSYIDEVSGAALVVKCVQQSPHGTVLKLEGTVHELGRQYRLFPAETWIESLKVTNAYVTADYVMTAMTPAWQKPYTEKQYRALEGTHESFLHGEPLRRNKRQTTTKYYIDVLPVVDYKLYQVWLSKKGGDSEALKGISDYITQLFASVALRVDTLNIAEKKLELRMLAPFIATSSLTTPTPDSLEEKSPEGITGVNATRVLSYFSSWVANQLQYDLPKNDHAMLLTGYEIYGSTDDGNFFNVTKGLANVGTICQGSQSVSLVEDRGAYQSEGVATHELGHSLGSVHDGSGEASSCQAADRFIMTDNFNYPHKPSTLLNPWKFSPCSSVQISTHILSIENNPQLRACLTETTGQLVTPSIAEMPNEICQDFYGPQSFACRGVNTPIINKVCDSLYCRVPGSETCVLMQAPTGTCCDNGKSCLMGLCQQTSISSQCVMDASCPLGDQPGVVVNNLTCAQIPSCFCYQEEVANKCCKTCADRKINQQGCFYGDKVCNGCDAKSCGTNLTTGGSYNFMCCQTCQNVQCTDTKTLKFEGTIYNCDEFLKTRKHHCYDPEVESGCCRSCEELRNKTRQDCIYGDDPRTINCATLLTLTRDCYEEEEVMCCDTCAIKRELAKITTPAPSPASPTTTPTTTPSVKECSGLACSGVSIQATLVLIFFAFLFTVWGNPVN